MLKAKKQRGFTLLEMVVYVALASLLSVAIMKSLIITTRAFNELRIDRDINDSAIAIMERLTREIKNAKSIDVVASTFGTATSRLRLNTTDASGTAVTVEFFVSSSTLHVKENDVDKGALNSGRTTVNSFVLYRINNVNSSAVKIELFLSGQRGPTVKQEVYYDTAVLRDAY